MALRTDGNLVAWGLNLYGEGNVPPLPQNVRYVRASCSESHGAAIRSDGQAIAWGQNNFGQCNTPALPAGVTYTDVDTIYTKTVLCRSDGHVVCFGDSTQGQLNVPLLPPGVYYRKVSCARNYSAGLRSDGQIVTWGTTLTDPFPPLPAGIVYVEMASGEQQTAARRSDGQVVVCGNTLFISPCLLAVPPLDTGTSYVQVVSAFGTIVARVGPESSYVRMAQGCAGSRQAARLVACETPKIGDTQIVNAMDLPQDVAIMVFGFAVQNTNLSQYGMPGCTLHVSPDGAYFIVGSAGSALHRFAIPDSVGLVGMRFWNQAIVLDAAAGNAAGAVVSDAYIGTIGT